MVEVDAEGRVALPAALRERLGITPGTEVEVRAENGRAVIEPADDPERILERMEELIEEAGADGEPEPTPYEELPPVARKHADRIRRGIDDDG